MHLYPTQRSPGRHFLVAFALICGIIFADQYTKWLVMEHVLRVAQDIPSFGDWFLASQKFAAVMGPQEFRSLTVTPWLNLVMVWNKGISFGMFDSASSNISLVFIGISLLISLLMLIWLALTPSKLVSFALALIIGGAVGNIIDRLRFSAVVDFIDLHLDGRHWPAFNLADSCIVLGAVLLSADALFRGGKNETVETEE